MSEKNSITGKSNLPVKSEFLLYQAEDGQTLEFAFRMKPSG